jgi:hypothetical protein
MAAAKTWRLDASSEGCTGLYWRRRLDDGGFITGAGSAGVRRASAALRWS